MSKYIDAEKLIALIDAKLEDLGLSGSVWVGRSVLQDLKKDIITSLQQEQPFPRWIHANYSDKPEIRYTPSGIPYLQNGTHMIWLSELDTLPKDGKDLTNPIQEQPEVDLEKEMDEYYDSPLWEGEDVSWMTYTRIAHHFYELGQRVRSKISNNSLKELRKEVIKFNQDHFDELHSDMDTIDIVHIVASHFFELGRNSRKEDTE